jgi:hypothetical protein
MEKIADKITIVINTTKFLGFLCKKGYLIGEDFSGLYICTNPYQNKKSFTVFRHNANGWFPIRAYFTKAYFDIQKAIEENKLPPVHYYNFIAEQNKYTIPTEDKPVMRKPQKYQSFAGKSRYKHNDLQVLN